MASEQFAVITTPGGAFDLKVIERSATLPDPDMLGEFVAGDDNSMQNSLRSPKRKCAFVAKFASITAYKAFLAAISETGAVGVPVAGCSITSPADGVTGGDTYECWVRLGSPATLRSSGGGSAKTTDVTAPIAVREA